MEGETYRALGGRVRVDGGGIDCYRRPHGGIRVTWAGIRDLRTGEPGAGGRRRRAVVADLIDGSTLILPAPRDGRGARRAAAFAAAQAAILATYAAYLSSVSGPQDAVPEEYRPAFVEPIAHYGGRLAPAHCAATARSLARPGVITLVLFFAASVFTLCAGVHNLLSDAPAYNAFRSPSSCSADEAADPNGTGGFCLVKDGYLYSITAGLLDNEVVLGPNPETGVTEDSFRIAYFTPPVSDVPYTDDPVVFIEDETGRVDTFTIDGATFQADGSPVFRHVSDVAAITMGAIWTLLFAYWIGFRARRRRYTPPRITALAALAAASIAAVVIGNDASYGSACVVLTPGGVFAVAGIVAACVAVVGGVVARSVRRLRPLSRRRRALP